MENLWHLKMTYAQLPSGFFQNTQPTAVQNAKGLLFNNLLASEIGLLNNSANSDLNYPNHLTDVLSGNETFEGVTSIAQAYAGHQFGHFTKLGDGRAVLLGEYQQSDNQLMDIQLKGSGPTVFSRRGDGRAALGPMLREYLLSEAMHSLEVPTTRSLSVCLSGESVQRENILRGAILTRLAKSHIRVGTFEYAIAFLNKNDLRELANYVILRHLPMAKGSLTPYKELLKNVIEKQALLIAKWMKYGFIHGVMNTDNVSISGETIDYGPCAFMEAYVPRQVFSSIDHQGRYAFNNQPNITSWNLACFAETLIPLLDDNVETAYQIAEECLSEFKLKFETHWHQEMLLKIGLKNPNVENIILLQDLLKIMELNSLDFTNTFLHLSYDDFNGETSKYGSFKISKLDEWKNRWFISIEKESKDLDLARKIMKNHNPLWIARNHLVEKALAMAEKNLDLSLFLDLLEALRSPFRENNQWSHFQKPAEESERVCQTFCGT